MDIREYGYVLAVVNCGGISSAAKDLHISQPALSLYMQSLEERLGFKLFYKSGGSLYLTDMGKVYVEYAEKIAALDAALGRKLREMKNLDCGEVSLGVTKTRGMMLLEKLLPRFREAYPDITVKVLEGTSSWLEEMVGKHRVDIAILNQPLQCDELEYTVLARDEIVVTVPKGNPVNELVRKKKTCPAAIDVADLADQPFILLNKEQRMRQVVDALFAKAGIEPNVLWEISSAVTAYKLSAAGLGLSIVTADFCRAQENESVNYYAIGNPPVAYDVAAVYTAKDKLSGAALAMLGMVEKLYAEYRQHKNSCMDNLEERRVTNPRLHR